MRIGVITLAASVLATTPVSAQSFAEVLAFAYETNPQLEAQRAQLRSIDEGLAQARAARLPTVTGGVSYVWNETRSEPARVIGQTTNEFDDPVDILDPSDQLEELRYTISASQQLYAGGSISGAIREARANIEAGRADLASLEQVILRNAATAYVDVRRDERVLDIRANNVEVLRSQLRATRDRFEVGETTRTDVAQAEARLAGAEASLAAAEAQLAASRAQFAEIIGQSAGSLNEPPPLPPLPETLDLTVDQAKRGNPTVLSARFNEQAAQARISQARAALLPSLSLQSSLSRDENQRFEGDDAFNSFGFQTESSDSVSVSLNLSVPLYAGGRNSSGVRQAEQLNSASILNVRNAERSAEQQAISAWNNVLSAESQILSSRQQVRANSIAFDGVRQEANVGLRTTLDILDAQQELLNAQENLVVAERNAFVARIAILEAIGRLTPAELGLPAEVYDPTAYSRRARRFPIVPGIIDAF